MALLGALDKMNKQKIIDFVMSCEHPDGSFAGNVGHDPHLLYTLSAVQILALFDELDKVDKNKITKYVRLQT